MRRQWLVQSTPSPSDHCECVWSRRHAEHGRAVPVHRNRQQYCKFRRDLVGRRARWRKHYKRWHLYGTERPWDIHGQSCVSSGLNRVGNGASHRGDISEGQIPGYDVGVDYHAFGTDNLRTRFITIYDQPAVRQQVQVQLQGMADRGATFLQTAVWFVTEPGTTNFGESWRATFPMTDQEAANLRAYAQDVASVQGTSGNRLRLHLALNWLGAADCQNTRTQAILAFRAVNNACSTGVLQLCRMRP
jgi:hypothetical protein